LDTINDYIIQTKNIKMKKIYFSIQLIGIGFLAMAQNAPTTNISILEPAPICTNGGCTLLTTEHVSPQNTTNYTVNSIPYSPSFPFFGGTTLSANADDVWSPTIALPFTFGFYGNTYNSLLVGSNGVVTFDLTNNNPSGNCQWSFNQTIPNPTFPIRNAIYGVYQDTNISSPPVTNPALQNVNYYILDTGANASPNRVFVINFNELPQYQCNTSVGFQTSQIVLYESTNIIDIYVKSRNACTTWNAGSGLIGIQNQAGTNALVPAGRNTGTWTTTNEAWRITPNGGYLPTTFQWYLDGLLLPNEFLDSLIACPNGNSSYSVKMSVLNADSSITVVSSNEVTPYIVPEPAFENPQDLIFCTQEPFVYVANLTTNTNLILGALNSNDYSISYYETLVDAENLSSNFIANPSNYAFTENKTIYVSIQEEVATSCHYIKSFALTIIPVVNAPTGAPNQNFTSGQTLADLIVIGDNLTWYDAPTEGNLLPSSTLLQDNTTYYATQSVSGCESNRNVNANRFAVTTNLVLSNTSFTASDFSVYPNPVADMLNVAAKDNLKSVIVYNAIGQQILHLNPDQKEMQIATTKFSKGVYFIKLSTEKGSHTLKIIKN
jgi:hypothetical protein